jgi:hypothetical protein
MAAQIQALDAAFGGRAQEPISAGATGGACTLDDPARLNGIGAQFAAHLDGLSGEQHRFSYVRVSFDAPVSMQCDGCCSPTLTRSN